MSWAALYNNGVSESTYLSSFYQHIQFFWKQNKPMAFIFGVDFIPFPLRIFSFFYMFYVAKIVLPKFTFKIKPLIVAIKHAEASQFVTT